MSTAKTLPEILASTPSEDLIQLGKELSQDIIPLNAKIRALAKQIYIHQNEPGLIHIVGLAPAIATELAKRLTDYIEQES